MRIRLSTLQLLGLALLVSALSFAGTFALAKSPPVPHPKQHTTQSDFWDAIRMRPVKVTSIEGNTFYWQFQDTRTVDLGSFVTDEYTEGKPEEGKTFIVIYCDTHKVAYRVVPLKQ